MTEELMKQICRAVYYGYDTKKIAEIESLSEDEVNSAVTWGNETQYFTELDFEVEEATE